MLGEFIKTANWTLFPALQQLKLKLNPLFPICLTGSEIQKHQNRENITGEDGPGVLQSLRLLNVCFLYFFAVMNSKFGFVG